MLKSDFVEHIWLTFFKYVFFLNGYMLSKVIISKLHPSPHQFLISQINIMYKYTETESKYTGKIGTHSMWEQIYIIL